MATNRPKLKFLRGATYTFDVSAPALANHPFKFTADSGSTEYTTGVTLTGTQGQAGAEITIVVDSAAPNNLNYYCGDHGLGKGNHILIPDAPVDPPDSDGSFLTTPFRSHLNVTAATGTLYTGGSGNVFYMAVDEGVPATNESDGTFFTDSDITIGVDSDYQYGGGHGNVFDIQTAVAGTNAWGGTRGFTFGGTTNLNNSTRNNSIHYFDTTTPGNAIDFGDLLQQVRDASVAGNITRLLRMGGYISGTPARSDTIDYITCATPGNAIDFGNLIAGAGLGTSASDGNYGIQVGGSRSGGPNNRIEYVTIATPGNAIDFGDLTADRIYNTGTNDKTRGVSMGSNGLKTDIDYFTMATPGNASDFGDLVVGTHHAHNGTVSNDTRGLIMGGTDISNYRVNKIEFITIQTTGNATDFGDMSTGKGYLAGCSNETGDKGFAIGGSLDVGESNVIEVVTISTAGNATDFGDGLNNYTQLPGGSGAAA